jgi:RHS repeat-associated protein
VRKGTERFAPNEIALETNAYDGCGTPFNDSEASSFGSYKWIGRDVDAETRVQYEPTTYQASAKGRWTSEDPLGFEAADANLYRYVGNNSSNATDPSGFWNIKRSRESRYATATATRGQNTVQQLARKIGLAATRYPWNSSGEWEHQYWLNEGQPVTLISGKRVLPGKLEPSDKIKEGEVVRVPNTIYMVWFGDNVFGLGKPAVGWWQDVEDFGRLGFHVVWDDIDAVPSNGKPFNATAAIQRMVKLTKDGHLQGMHFTGHGEPASMHARDPARFRFYYHDYLKQSHYRLGVAILNVCEGAWSHKDNPIPDHPGGILAGGKDLVPTVSESPDRVFVAVTGTYIPVLRHHSPIRYLRGKQGTNSP